jgi:amino acid transporter
MGRALSKQLTLFAGRVFLCHAPGCLACMTEPRLQSDSAPACFETPSANPARNHSPAGASDAAAFGGPAEPRRVLGFRDLVLFYIVVTLSLRWIPFAAAAGPGTVVIWLVGVLTIFLPLALCVMELSSRYPQEGGMYVWSKLAFGDFAGFLTGWIYWTSNLPYFPTLLYFAASNALYLGSGRWQKLQSSPLYFVLFSFAGLLLALGLNLVGLNVGKWLNNAGALGTWIPILLIWAMGAIAFWRLGSATHFTAR